MITCSDLQGRPLYINPDLMERIEVTPDTQVVFVNGKRLYVSEKPEVLVERIIAYRRQIGGGGAIPSWPGGGPADVNEE